MTALYDTKSQWTAKASICKKNYILQKNEATNNIMALEHKGSWPMSINVKQYGQPLLPDIVLSIVATIYIYPFAIDHLYQRYFNFEIG